MGILDRFTDIMSSNLNAALDKLEDPGKMVDQYLRKAKEDLAEVKKQTAAVMAEEKRCKRILDDVQAQVNKCNAAARNALIAGDENGARALLTRAQQAEAQLPNAQQTFNAARANSAKMRQLHDKLVQDISSLEARRANVKATQVVAKSQQTVNKFSTSFGVGSKAMDGFARMEQRAQAALDAAEAEAELNQMGIDPTDNLLAKYATPTSGGPVDDALARMKQELGI